MTTADESRLVAVMLPAPAAAAAISRTWDGGGAVAVVDPGGPNLRERLERLAPTHVIDIAGEHRYPAGRGVASTVAAVVATSGTTGAAQFVELTIGGLRASAEAVHAALDVDPDRDRWLACVPLHHVAGLAIVARAYFTDTSLTVHPRFDPSAIARDADAATLISLVPTMLRRVLDSHPPVLRKFRQVLVGGGPIAPALHAAATDAGVALVTTYGLTETGGGCVHDGHALAGVEIAVRAGPDGRGEICVRGPVLMRGYRAASGEGTTTSPIDADGWFPTGDTGVLDGTGRLTVVDRIKDLIITGGVNTSPIAIERKLATVVGIADVAVVGAEDAEWGERVVACVVPTDPAAPPTLAALRDAGRAAGLGEAELPRELRIVATIPRTPGGKILRTQLR